MTNAIPEISTDSDVIFVIGSNTAECHPLVARHVVEAQARGAKLIVADPRLTEMANKADVWLRVPIGYNVPLVNALLHVIIAEKLYDATFVQEHVDGFEAVARSVEDYTPAHVAQLTGLPAGDIVAAARLYAQAKAAVILYCMGVTQFTLGTGNVVSLANLAVIAGQIGRPGAGVCPLRGQNNVQGACDMGALPNVFPGYLPVTDDQHRAHFEAAWNAPLSSRIGLKLSEVAEATHAGRVRAAYIFGENPVMSDPDVDHFVEALEGLDLLVVQDIFLTETARLAHIVLPAAGWGEKEGTFVNTERRVQRVRQAVDPPGQARPDWQIFAELARRMGYAGMEYQQPRDIWDEVRRLVPAKFGGITYERLEAERGLSWPCPVADHPGTPILHLGGRFLTPSGRANLRPVLFDPAGVPAEKVRQFPTSIAGAVAERAETEYPFILTTGRRGYHYHTGTMTRKAPAIQQVGPEQLVELNSEDAAALGVLDGDFVRVSTRRGVIAAKAWVTERVPAKTVFTTFHFWEANANELTNAAARDPISGIPEFKISAARVEKITSAEARALLEAKRQKYRVALEDEVAAEARPERVA